MRITNAWGRCTPDHRRFENQRLYCRALGCFKKMTEIRKLRKSDFSCEETKDEPISHLYG